MKIRDIKLAWTLWKNDTVGLRSFGKSLKAALNEGKGLLVICEQIEPGDPPMLLELEPQEVMYLVAIGKLKYSAGGEFLPV